MRLSFDGLWLSTRTWGRRGRRLARALLIATGASIGVTGRLGGKQNTGEGGRW
jgi:hypothetical protein